MWLPHVADTQHGSRLPGTVNRARGRRIFSQSVPPAANTCSKHLQQTPAANTCSSCISYLCPHLQTMSDKAFHLQTASWLFIHIMSVCEGTCRPENDEAVHRHLAGCFQEGETALSMAMRSVNPQCVLFARAVYEAALEKCNSSKSFKSK